LDDLKHDIFISPMDGGKQMTQTKSKCIPPGR